MNKIDALANILEDLYPYKLSITDDSFRHVGHYQRNERDDFPSHVTITIISAHFNDLSRMGRQRLVNKVLKPAFEHGLHAASIKAYTISEFKEMQKVKNKSFAFAS